MKTRNLSLIVFLACCGIYFGCLAWTAPMLPDRLATHFGANGQADGWMTRSFYLCFVGAFGVGVPSFIVALFYAMRFMPLWCFNVPNRDYWFAPERRKETLAFLFRQSFWHAGMFVLFFTGLHLLTIEANRHGPNAANLSMIGLGIVAGGFVLGSMLWLIPIMRYFKKVD